MPRHPTPTRPPEPAAASPEPGRSSRRTDRELRPPERGLGSPSVEESTAAGEVPASEVPPYSFRRVTVEPPAPVQAATSGVLQLYRGTPLESLHALLSDLLKSGKLENLTEVEAIWPIVYQFYSEGPEPVSGQVEEVDFYGALTEQGIPSKYLRISGGFLHVDNPDYDSDLIFSGGFSRERLAVHIRPDQVVKILVACYDQFRSMDPKSPFRRVESFKVPTRMERVERRLDNLVIYFVDTPDGAARDELIDYFALLSSKELILPEHPAMLAPTKVPGVGLAEGLASAGEARSKIIAEAYSKWNKKGGVEGLEKVVLKLFASKGYNLEDLSREPSSGSKKEDCLVSTACTGYLGLDDDCLELAALRRLRDEWVLRQPWGEREVETYLRLAPTLVRGLNTSRRPLAVYRHVYRTLIAPVVARVLADEPAEAFELYKRRILELQARLRGMPSRFPPSSAGRAGSRTAAR